MTTVSTNKIGSTTTTTGSITSPSPQILHNETVQHISKEELPDWMMRERTKILYKDYSTCTSHHTTSKKATLKSIDTTSASGSTSTTATTTPTPTPVIVYWMQRDVRTTDNWALLLAVHYYCSAVMAATTTTTTGTVAPPPELHVVYALPPPPPPPEAAAAAEAQGTTTSSSSSTDRHNIPDLVHLPMTVRHGQFLLGGLECVYNELQQSRIPLHVVLSNGNDDVGTTVGQLLQTMKCTTLITDFSPLRHHREWKEIQCLNTIIPPSGNNNNINNESTATTTNTTITGYYQVDTHNVVPVWMASTYREYGARTIRPKINKQYQAYLQKFPKWNELLVAAHQQQQHQSESSSVPSSSSSISPASTKNSPMLPPFQRLLYETYMKMDVSVPELSWAIPGTDAALRQVQTFFDTGLSKFDTQRNDPNCRTICSNLSPWINHGHVSFQRITMAVKKYNKYANGTASYLEEGIVRRELSDNYCYYDPYRYDQLTAAAGWAQETLQTHSSDVREYLYTLQEFEQGQTHDDLWNAAQLQAVRDGKMHGFLRMYWAKKILEWTESPDAALRTALYLNDKYNIDGRDPNGFVGVGWSIMGIHDMGWKERDIFGKIRFMNYAGCKRKFKVDQFVSRYPGAAEQAKEAMKKHHGQDIKIFSESKPSAAKKSKKTTKDNDTTTKSETKNNGDIRSFFK